MNRSLLLFCRGVVLLLAGLSAACTTSPTRNTAGSPTVELDPNSRGPVAGVGVEGQDITSMTDKMMRDMLSNPTLANRQPPAQVIVDGEYFSNESSQRINRNLIADRLRVGLLRASQGRMLFVSRQSAEFVEKERNLKRSGQTEGGTTGQVKAQTGADYRLRGNIASLDSVSGQTGVKQRYTQITFEMIDLERGTIVWSGIYEFARAAADDIIYQ
ncbi:MAG TPA: CsgG/HfaB family protein [Stellaceae bacterium]|nr:CsgG/HfaB family protein [Stellaceae bacterium]